MAVVCLGCPGEILSSIAHQSLATILVKIKSTIAVGVRMTFRADATLQLLNVTAQPMLLT